MPVPRLGYLAYSNTRQGNSTMTTQYITRIPVNSDYTAHGGDGMTLKEAAALLGVSTHLARSILELDEHVRAGDNLDAETVAYVINANYHTQGSHNVHATR